MYIVQCKRFVPQSRQNKKKDSDESITIHISKGAEKRGNIETEPSPRIYCMAAHELLIFTTFVRYVT